MSFFKNKVVLLISQQNWGKMFISKHHYAIELSKIGAKVYFLQGPTQDNTLTKGIIKIKKSEFKDLYIIEHSVNFPYNFKFHFKWLYKLLIRLHIKKIINKLGESVDIVWSFDISNTLPLSCFDKDAFKIFMPVDEPYGKQSIAAAKGSKLVISITREIIAKYNTISKNNLLINHGIQDCFLKNSPNFFPQNHKPRVILSGNFLRPDIDWDTLFVIINQNKEIDFHFYGAYKLENNNLTPVNPNQQQIDELIKKSNVQLFGPVKPIELAAAFSKANAFLICYDINKDQSKGTNYHKIMEFLSSGKVIISNNVTAYAERPDLVAMPIERNNSQLPNLFRHVMEQLDTYNTVKLQQARISFAADNTYPSQIKKIENYINEHG